MGRHQGFTGSQGILRLQGGATARTEQHHAGALLSPRQRHAIGIGQGQHNPHPRRPALGQQRNAFGQAQLTTQLQRQLTDGCHRTRAASLLQQIKPQAKVCTNGVLAQRIPFTQQRCHHTGQGLPLIGGERRQVQGGGRQLQISGAQHHGPQARVQAQGRHGAAAGGGLAIGQQGTQLLQQHTGLLQRARGRRIKERQLLPLS